MITGNRIRSSLLVVAVLVHVTGVTTTAAQEPLRTESEESGFERHTSYENMAAFLLALRAQSTDVRLASFGQSYQGRDLPYAIFARPMVTQPAEALVSGRPIVVLAANVHGGERTFRESTLLLARELATPGTEMNAVLDDMIILVVPSLNPDGFEATRRGTRGNAWGIDMNRDYVKLEQPATAHYIKNILNAWHPHLFVDGHNGGSVPYNLNYQCTSNAAADLSLTLICDDELFPFIDQKMLENGFESWYYTGGTETRWNGGGSDVRIGRNYGGLANKIGVLFEAPRQPLEIGVKAGLVAYKAVVEYVHQNTQHVMNTVQEARRKTVELGQRAEGEVPVQMEYVPEDYQVTYKIVRDDEVLTVTSDSLMKKPLPTLLRPRPYAYLLPRDAVDAVAMLRRHNITVELLEDEAEIEVEAYTLAGIEYERAYNHAAAVRAKVADVVRETRTFPPGTYVVPTGQILGRVVTHMLEPETSDNVVYWNTMDAWLPRPAVAESADQDAPVIPIYKIMRPTPLPSRIMVE